jgi:hypothetical protein
MYMFVYLYIHIYTYFTSHEHVTHAGTLTRREKKTSLETGAREN